MTMARTNEEWIRALSQQDSAQSEALVDLRDLLLRATLYTLVSHLEDLRELSEKERRALAEDCAQDALHAVLTKLSDFRGESKFTTWAYKFGINVALSRSRQERWKHISLEALTEDDDTLEWLQMKDDAQAFETEMPTMRSEVSVVIRQVVRSDLSVRQRQVLKWIAFDDVPMDVVVERLGSNRNSVYKLLHDARLKIKRKLAACGYAVEEIYNLFGVG